LEALHFAIAHLGQSIDGVRLEYLIWPLVLTALFVASCGDVGVTSASPFRAWSSPRGC
jgi:hypothetical protein